ncbi:signal recognition particle 68 [Rhodnius prolixus]
MVVAEAPIHLENADQPEESTPVKQGPVFTVEILKIITDAQQQHGLRHSDYQRYRGYCTRRIRRLRKTLHLPQGDKRHFKRRDVTEIHLKDERYLYIPLMLSERAWGYAMQLRQESNTEPRKRFHLVSKLRKAVHYAEQLESLCQSELCDARSKLESQAYAAWIRGSFFFEVKAWKEAMDNLQQAQVVYEKLCSAVNESDQAVYKNKCEELVPSLRYCAYSIGDNTAISDLKSLHGTAQGELLDTLDRLMAEARQKEGGGGVSEVSWQGRTVGVKHPIVSTFLSTEQELDAALEGQTSEANIDKLDRHVINCKDAIAALKDDINNDPSSKTKSPDGSVSALQYLLSYLTYIRLNRSNQRTLFMIKKAYSEEEEGKKGKPQDLIRLYELILQNLNEMQQLVGLEQDKNFQDNIEASLTGYKAYRCYYIGEVLTGTKKFREALALYDRAGNYCCSVAERKDLEKTLKYGLKELSGLIEAAKSICLAQAVLQASEENKDDIQTTIVDKKYIAKVPLVDRLDIYYEDPKIASKQANIIKLPPDMKPIPCKPLFFDVALNHLTFPSLQQELESKTKQGQSSLTGFVKGLWGWGGKK